MKHTLEHLSLTLALAMLASSGLMAANAAAAPEMNGATIEAAVGKVTAKSTQGAYKAARMGQILLVGASVRTAAGAKASLRLADGNLLRLAPNSELLIKAATKAEGSFLRLAKGMSRFLVAKVKPGQQFKVETTNAVAAVKGTDAEVESGAEGRPDEFRVYESGNENALEVTDEESGKSQSIGEGEELQYDGNDFQEEEIDQADREQSNEGFEGLPEPVVEQGSGDEGGEQGGQSQDQPGNAQAGTSDGQGSSEGQGNGEGELAEAIEDALEQLSDDLALDGQLDNDTRTSDLASGKLTYDRHGYLVQVDHYVERPEANIVRKSAYSLREEGEHAGLSFAIEETTFNQGLPEDWVTIFNRALNHPDNLDPANGNYPIFYRDSQTFLAGNPAGDLLGIDTTFQVPSWPMSSPGQASALQQGWAQEVWVDTLDSGVVSKGTFEVFGSWYDPANHLTYGALGDACSTCTNEDFSKNPSLTVDGGWQTEFIRLNDSSSVFTQTIHLIDNDGNVLDLGDLASAGNVSDFRGLSDSINLEVNFSAPEFYGRSIDLVFFPSHFDAYDFYTLPDSYVPYFFAP